MTGGDPIRFRIVGMDCADEVAVLKREIGPLVGGAERLSFDILNGRMIIDSHGPRIAPQLVVNVGRLQWTAADSN